MAGVTLQARYAGALHPVIAPVISLDRPRRMDGPAEERCRAKLERLGDHEVWTGAVDASGTGLVRVDGTLRGRREVVPGVVELEWRSSLSNLP